VDSYHRNCENNCVIIGEYKFSILLYYYKLILYIMNNTDKVMDGGVHLNVHSPADQLGRERRLPNTILLRSKNDFFFLN